MPALQLLDLLVELVAERLLVLDLAGERTQLLLLPLQHLAQLHLVPLQVGHSLLGQLQIALGLSLELLYVAPALLLPLPGVLNLVELLLQPVLQLTQVVALVLARLNLEI